jgi:predicted 3-demethylubiquinone-9 3-methyltransferase (glyoxalase superfamily)
VIVQKIVPFLWFDDNGEEAMTFYASVFPDAKIAGIRRYGSAGPGMPGKFMTGTITIFGQELMVLNGGPHHKLTPAFSLFVKCKDQDEVDYYWSRLVDGGREDRCGWLTDKFGVSWQIIPDALGKFLGDPDPVRANRAMQAMLGMRKIDVAALERAATGSSS